MNHGGWPSLDYPGRLQYYRLAVNGAGAAAPTLPPGLTAVQPDFPAACSVISRLAAEIPTRAGVGSYVITVDPSFKLANWLECPVEIYGTVGAWGQVSLLSAATRQITLKTFAAAGAAADLAIGDLCVMTITGLDGSLK